MGRFGFILFIGCAATGPTSASEPESRFVSSRIEDRVVKRFDFDERKLGNFEMTPMNWRQIAGPGYPRFLEPRIDADVGHDAPPSFRLALQGGSLACRYLAKDIPVHPDSDYHISVWIRTSGVLYSEAYVSAYFLDHALQRIDASSVRNDSIHGAHEDEPWREVSVLLPGGFEKARWIGLSCHLEQPAEVLNDSDDLRPIEQRDPHATAWFDDITVTRLPRVFMRMEAAGSVFTADESANCLVRVADVDGRGLAATLDVRDIEGRIIESQPISVVAQDGAICSAELGVRSPGRYFARLVVSAADNEMVSYERPFVRLSPDLTTARPRRGGYGLLLDPTDGVDHRTVERLVGLLSPDFVKIPLWRADMNDEAVVVADHRIDGLVRALNAQAVSIIGVLAAPPSGLAEQLGHRGLTVVDVLAAPANQWRPYLGFLFSRYGERVNAWQVGTDDATMLTDSQRVTMALEQLREGLRPLAGSFQLAVPQDAAVRTLSDPSIAEIESLYVGAQISADRLSEQVGSSTAPTKVRRWVTLEALDPAKYPLRIRLREEARRMVMALQTGAEAVFVPQPWSIVREGGETVVTPSEEFFIFRTLRQTLAGMSPMGRVWFDDGVSAWLFGDAKADEGALVVWTDGDEESPRRLLTDAVPVAKAVDLWGVPSEGRRALGGKEFTLGSMPIVLAPVAPSRVRTMASFSLSPTNVTPTIEEQRVTLSLRNQGPKRMVERLRLVVPPSWRITPSQVSIDVPSGQEVKTALSLRLPSNQAAGAQVLVGLFSGAEGDEPHYTLRTPIFVRSIELDVKVLTRVEGRGLRVVQRVTNLSERTLNLRGLLIAPNQPRQVCSIKQLIAGQSAVREYQIENGASLADRFIRVSVEQVDGPLRHHDVIKVE